MTDLPSFANLDEARAEIDRIDTELLALLTRRSGVSLAIGDLKTGDYARASIASPAFRPAREMRMVRRLRERCQPPMNFETAYAIWREIVGASSASQAPLVIAAADPVRQGAARNTFGVASTPLDCADEAEVIAAVGEGRAGIGLLPAHRSGGWGDLPLDLNITCALPFYGVQIDALAIARTPVEESGDDVTLALNLNNAAHPTPLAASGLFHEGGFAGRPSLAETLDIAPESLRVLGACPVPLFKS